MGRAMVNSQLSMGQLSINSRAVVVRVQAQAKDPVVRIMNVNDQWSIVNKKWSIVIGEYHSGISE